MERPSPRAVLRLMRNSNRVGCRNFGRLEQLCFKKGVDTSLASLLGLRGWGPHQALSRACKQRRARAESVARYSFVKRA
jgi:hypothetical protein